MKPIYFMITTIFGLGYIKIAPGTFGSFISTVLIYFLRHLLNLTEFIFLTIIIFIIGLLATKEVLKYTEHDPSFVVIDEMVGQNITFMFIFSFLQQYRFELTWGYWILGFLLFRVFDIVKPEPAKFFDQKVKNAFGVMFDDVIAGIYAGLVLWGIHLCWS